MKKFDNIFEQAREIIRQQWTLQDLRRKAQCTGRPEEVRQQIADLIGAPQANEVVFTRNTSESLNLVAKSFAPTVLEPGDEVVITIMEHHSNLIPWQQVCRKTGAKLVYLYPTKTGQLTTEEVLAKVGPKTKILAVGQVSNVLGVENPVKNLGKLVHKYGGYLVVDGAQSLPHMPVDVADLGADFFAFSAHKAMGPMGIGVLYGKRALLEAMPPFLGGGDMVDTVTFAKTTYAPVPLKFEAGTANFVGAIGLGEAVKFMQRFDPAEIEAHEEALLRRATERLEGIGGLRIYGTAPGKCAILSFNVEGVHPYDMGMILDKLGIAVRTGQHCAEPVMDHYGTTGMCRASFALYNTLAEADALAAGVERAVKMLRN